MILLYTVSNYYGYLLPASIVHVLSLLHDDQMKIMMMMMIMIIMMTMMMIKTNFNTCSVSLEGLVLQLIVPQRDE